jgi:hypothetical protein
MSRHDEPGHPHRVFYRFGKWPLVPAADLLKLRESLRQVQKLAGQDVTGELLTQVEHELHRRGHTPHKEHRSPTRTGTD